MIQELESAILTMTMEIRKKHTELSKYILEMPDTSPSIENSEMNRKVLQEYWDSLYVLLKDYIKTRPLKS